ncbi:MAG: 30S ribosomal protein S10 [archaeon]|jgi:small subunit ribosomal protein S10|nr:30S ribosomal protein S10 [archaeon]MDD2478077.1 30S ribosomal protein S10 [Candidatus ainarchaeum sp.]MDD3085022.1 30S ribosomal protein S10 [Candidatus ainarchaeum sp.]MDD4221491.1 30S ribosomal protein S10 [Candidatus ainarchaeum sp.]MDD4663015.1 30S ribosomal protein S10 [Candidatus ainarchaeum sp.]
MQTARIVVTSTDYKKLTDFCNEILDVAKKAGVKHSGIIPLKTKKLVVPTRRGASGGGTETYQKFQLRIHKRIIDVKADDKILRRVVRVDVPVDVHMGIELKA